MIHRISGLFTDIFRFQTDRFVTVILCVLALILFLGYSYIIVSKQGKTLFWIGSAVLILAFGLTIGLSSWRLPHGLSGSYYDNPSWSGEPVHSQRYFETPGRRVDRFIDFNPNDFNDRYPFSGKPFSVKWRGHLYTPGDAYQLRVQSTFGVWVYVDDTLIEGPHKIDFGTPEARTYLREGWSHDEQWGQNSNLSFVWSSGHRSEFYLGVDEVADYQLVFRCIPFSYQNSPEQKFTIAVNGITLGSPVILKDGWNTYRIPVPRSVIQDRVPGFFRVRFTYSNVVRPSEVMEHSEDGRQLAVAFDSAMMQKLSARFVDTQEIFQPYLFSQGIYHITLKAQSNGVDPFIQLVWGRDLRNKRKVIPEDYLFPESISPSNILQLLPRERIILGVSLLCKFFLSLFLGSLIFIYIFPYLKKGLTLNFCFSLGIGSFAMYLLVFFLIETTKVDPHFYTLPFGTDQLNYVFFARGFFRGYWPWYTYDTLLFNPLVPIFLIITHMLFGESLLVSRCIVAIFSAISLVLLYSITRKHFNKPIAVLAFLLCALNGVYIFYGTSLLVAPQVTFLNVAILWYIHRVPQKFSMKSAIILGLLFGLLALGRATFLLFLLFLFPWIFLIKGQTFFRKCIYCSIICCTLFLVILPITTLNYYSDHRHGIVLITNAGGWNFWMGNNSRAHHVYGYGVDLELHQKTKAHMKATGSTYVDEVFIFIKEQPLDYLKLQWRKFKMFWRGHEIGNLKPYYLFRENSSFLQLPLINFVILGPLSIIGLLLTCREWKKYYLLHAFVLVQIIINVLFLALARYRIPAVPILSIFAAYTLFSIYQAFQKRKFLQTVLLIVMCIALYITINYPHAARLYEQHYQSKMPLVQVLRYWDIFRFYGH